MKHCCNCKKKHPLDFFARNKGNKDGLAKACKACSRKANQKYRKKRGKLLYIKAYPRRQKQSTERRKLTLAYAASKGCIDCGEKDPIVLDYDHIIQSTKTMAISHLVSANLSIEKLKNEIAKCEIRCANCHRKKTAIQLGRYQNIDFSKLSEVDLTPLI